MPPVLCQYLLLSPVPLPLPHNCLRQHNCAGLPLSLPILSGNHGSSPAHPSCPDILYSHLPANGHNLPSGKSVLLPQKDRAQTSLLLTIPYLNTPAQGSTRQYKSPLQLLQEPTAYAYPIYRSMYYKSACRLSPSPVSPLP